MGKLDLRVRDLQSGAMSTMTFEDEAAARVWLTERPPFVEGLGVATPGIDPSVSQSLKEAMRPLDAHELVASRALDEAAAANERAAQATAAAVAAAAADARRAAMRDANPDRPMQIRWTYDGGMRLTDAVDERAITDGARDAVLAWIAERDEWVIDRGQIVGEATLTVWPNAVPAGKERVQHGTFFPVTAPAKGTTH